MQLVPYVIDSVMDYQIWPLCYLGCAILACAKQAHILPINDQTILHYFITVWGYNLPLADMNSCMALNMPLY